MTSPRLDGCPYYRGTGTCGWPGLCGGSMGEGPEPKCRTEEPAEGWAAHYASSECTCWAPDDAEPEDHDIDCVLNPGAEDDEEET